MNEFFDRKKGPNAGQPVPQDSTEYECCEVKADEQVACATNCCPEWHSCDTTTQTCSNTELDSVFTPGTNFQYLDCKNSCGPENHSAYLRCGCANQCATIYAPEVLIEATLPTGFTRHRAQTCDAITTPTVAAGATILDSAEGTADQAVVSSQVGAADYDEVVYRRTATKDCANPCCVSIQNQAVTCPALNCYDTNRDKPWFLSVAVKGNLADGSEIYQCTPGAPIYKSSRICACDAASTVATCTDNAVTYNEGQSIPDSNVQDVCEYKRKDYINYNSALAAINGKSDDDAYFCCTEEIEDELFTQWAPWSECVQSPSKNNQCGCASDPSDACGTQMRKRRAKCDGDSKVDDTTCPCIETRKCDLPLCPINPGKSAPVVCKLNPASPAVSYSVKQCSQMSDFTVNSFAATFQLTSTANAACAYCDCAGQITGVESVVNCGRFDTECNEAGVHHLIWAQWSTCQATTDTCGIGSRSRTRQCANFATEADIEAHCYNPTVLRTFAAGQEVAMKDHADYYESETCYISCPDDLIEYTPWTECSVKFGEGVQARHVVGHPDKVETRVCEGENLEPKTGKASAVYTECDATCGSGNRKKMTWNYDTQQFEIVDEPCSTLPACADPAALPACPALGKDVNDVVNGGATTQGPNNQTNNPSSADNETPSSTTSQSGENGQTPSSTSGNNDNSNNNTNSNNNNSDNNDNQSATGSPSGVTDSPNDSQNQPGNTGGGQTSQAPENSENPAITENDTENNDTSGNNDETTPAGNQITTARPASTPSSASILVFNTLLMFMMNL